jgi:hypothetical protein
MELIAAGKKGKMLPKHAPMDSSLICIHTKDVHKSSVPRTVPVVGSRQEGMGTNKQLQLCF